MSHPKPALSHSLLTLTEVQPSPGRDDRLLPHLGSPGCTSVNPASPPTPCELIRNILLLGSSNSQWRGLQAGLWVWTCLVMSRSGAHPPSLAPVQFWVSKGSGEATIFKGQRSNWVIAFTVTCSAFYCLHKWITNGKIDTTGNLGLPLEAEIIVHLMLRQSVNKQ